MKLLEDPMDDCQICFHSRAIWNGAIKWFCDAGAAPLDGECELFEREPGADG